MKSSQADQQVDAILMNIARPKQASDGVVHVPARECRREACGLQRLFESGRL
jgi:hypothetical protein